MVASEEGQARTYTMKEVVELTGKSISTLVKWEERGVFPHPKRRATTNARIFTQEHVDKIIAHRDAVKEPEPSKKRARKGRSP